MRSPSALSCRSAPCATTTRSACCDRRCRSDGGFRLYTEEDVDKLLVIRRMKPLGFTLEEMVDVMRCIEVLRETAPETGPSGSEGEGRVAEAHKHLADTLDEAHSRRDTLSRQLAMADEFIGLLIRQLG